ncbi:MAG: hypothetical protein ACHQ9S_02605 [Candidatus Binatia bacterium]
MSVDSIARPGEASLSSADALKHPIESSDRKHTPWWLWGTLLFAGALCVAQSLYFEWKLDDAYIAFVYAQNWVHGHGLVFNIGERVEGYTCFLWVALSALGIQLSGDVISWATALGILSGLGTIIATWRLCGSLLAERGSAAAILAAVLVAAYPPLAWWAGSGMETALFTFLITLALWRHVRHEAHSIAGPVSLAFASMTRPEGWLLSALLCLDAARRGPWRKAARYACIFLTIFGPYYAWRCLYYGYPFPNTFYAKVGATPAQVGRGLVYLRDFLLTGGGVWLLIGSVSALSLRIRRQASVIFLFLGTYFTYVVLVGGDAFPFYRFLVPIVPALAALSVAAILLVAQWSPKPRIVGPAACVVYLVGFLVACVPVFRLQQRQSQTQRMSQRWKEATCARIKALTDPCDIIATGGIGFIKFCSGRRVIDILGLADKHIAHQYIRDMGHGLAGHEKYDSEYVLARWPKYIILPPEGAPIRPAAAADLWKQPVLMRYYVPDAFGYRRIDTASSGAEPQ